MSSIGRVDYQWQNPTNGLEDVIEESMSETSFEQQAPPRHPIPTMQGAFEESISEEPEESTLSRKDSGFRRKILLERSQYQRIVGSKWTQKPGEKFHPLWKLVSQLAFGMHLLHQELAKSEEEVIKILQTHVDEVDGFLERTTEDFDLAQHDINERIRYLQLPLEHGEVFDTMLADRAFRAAMVEGNVKIEHIVDRTAMALTDSLKDVKKGSDGTKELARYLRRLEKTWRVRDDTITEVFHAMMGNTEGWTAALLGLQEKGKLLGKSLEHLRAIIAEIQRLVGIASRRNVTQQQTPHTASFGRSATTSQSPPKSRSSEEGDIVASSFATLTHGSNTRYEQEPKLAAFEGRNRSPPMLHANAILEEEDESDHFPSSSTTKAGTTIQAQAPTIVNRSDTIPEENDFSLTSETQTIPKPHTRNLIHDDKTEAKPKLGVSALGVIASFATDPNAKVPTSRSQIHDDMDRSTPRPSGRSTYTPRPEVIEEEDEDSDDSGYTADVIDPPLTTALPPATAHKENQLLQSSFPTDQTDRSHKDDPTSDYSPSTREFRSSFPKVAATDVQDVTKEFTLPPLDLETDIPLPALTPLDYERMRADRLLPAFDLQIPEEYVESDPVMDNEVSKPRNAISAPIESKIVQAKLTTLHRVGPQDTQSQPTNIEKSKISPHPFQRKESIANNQATVSEPSSSPDSHSSSSSLGDLVSMMVPMAEDRDIYHEEPSPQSAYTEVPWSRELEHDDAISYTDQYIPHPDQFVPDHLIPPRSDSLHLNSDQFVPHPDQFYQDSKRSSGQFIPEIDQFYQDSKSEYSLKMGLLSSDVPKISDSVMHIDRTSDKSSPTSENQLVDDMKTPVPNHQPVFPKPTTGFAHYEQENPPSEDEQPFPLPPHAEAFTRTQSMSEVISRKPVPPRTSSKLNSSKPAAVAAATGLGIVTATAATAAAVNETSISDTPTLTKQPRQLPIDDLLIRLRHGAGLTTPTEPDSKPDPTIDSLLRESDHIVESPIKHEGRADKDESFSLQANNYPQLLPDNKEAGARQPIEVQDTRQTHEESMISPMQMNSLSQPKAAEPADRSTQAIPTALLTPAGPANYSIQAEPVLHSARVFDSNQNAKEASTQQLQDVSILGDRAKSSEDSSGNNIRTEQVPISEVRQESSVPQISIQHEQFATAMPHRPGVLEPRLQRRASYSDDRTTQRLSAFQQSAHMKTGMLSPEYASISPKQYPHSALVPASAPWTFFSKHDMDHSYRHRRAHSLYSPATPYDLEWLLRKTPSDMAVSPMRWSDVYGWQSGQTSAVSSLGFPHGPRSGPLPPTKQDLSIDSILNGTGIRPAAAKATGAPIVNPPQLTVNDLDVVREQLSHASEVKPIQPAWREPTLREQKADRPTVRASSIYSKAPDLDLGLSPPLDIPRIVRTETGYESYYGDTQPSSAYTDMTFGQISPAPAISSAKPSPLHFVSRDQMPNAPASPGSPKEDPKFPLEVSDEKQTVMEMPPISPSLKSLTSATITGPEPDFPFLSATYGGPEPDYYYYSTSFDELEGNHPKRTNSELAAQDVTEQTRHEHLQQDVAVSQQSDADYSAQEPPSIEGEGPLQLSQPGGFSTVYSHNSMSRRREGLPAALNLKLFPSMDSISRAATSPRSPRPQDLIAESGRSVMTLPGPNLSNANLQPPVATTQEQAAPVMPQKPNRSPLKKLLKDALSPSILSSKLKRDKGHRRGRSSVENPLARDATIANAQAVSGMTQTYGTNRTSDPNTIIRKGSMPVLSDGRRPSGERILFGLPGSDGRPF